jgi:hypothetical protein
MMRRILQPLWVLLAVVFLIEAWCWDHLEPVVERVVALIPLREFKVWLTQRVEGLSPAMALLVFAVPVAPLYPVKLFGLWLLAGPYWIGGIITLAIAQFIGLGVAAFIFDVTKPKLLQMRWFAATYRFVVLLREKARAVVAPMMVRIKAAMASDGAGWTSRMLRLVQRFRRKVQQAR